MPNRSICKTRVVRRASEIDLKQMRQKYRLNNFCLLFVLTASCVAASDANAQQAWQITTTTHFDCYFELQSQDRVNRVLFEAERAYARISLDLRHDLAERVPLVFVGGDAATTAGLGCLRD